jgi:hypothetical protein
MVRCWADNWLMTLPVAMFERGEQVDRAVPTVVEAASLGCSRQQGQHRDGPLQGLDLWFLVHGEDHRMSWLG